MCFDFIIMKLNQSHNANTNRDLIFMSNVSLSSPYFIMTIIKAFKFFVLFTLLLADQGHVNVFEDLLSLRFNLQIRTIYESKRCIL